MPRDLQIIRTCSETISTSPIFFLQCGLFLTDHLFSPVIDIRACCSTQTKYWIPVLETYWSIITSIAFQIILVQYQYSIEILNYFSVSLSVFQKKIKGPKFEHFIVLKRFFFRKCIVINFFQVNCQISYQKCQIVYIIEQNVIYTLNK